MNSEKIGNPFLKKMAKASKKYKDDIKYSPSMETYDERYMNKKSNNFFI